MPPGGSWQLVNSTLPPYDLGHLADTVHHSVRVEQCARDTPGWRFGWVERGEGPELKDASQFCSLMRGTNILLLGDSLSMQMYESWRARLRQERYANGNEAGQRHCHEVCEGPAPVLCSGLCAGSGTNDNDRYSSHYSVCDNGAAAMIAQIFRWTLSAHSFHSGDSRVARCAQRLRINPREFDIVPVPRKHVDMLLEYAARSIPSPRPNQQHGVHRLAVVYNQLAHIHPIISKLTQCYERHGGLEAALAESAATRDVLRFWAQDQAKWAVALQEARRALMTARPDLTVDIFYRTAPASSCDYFCKPPFPREPLELAQVVRAVLQVDSQPMHYSHQYAYWVNDMARAAFAAQGFGIIDLEPMLSVRADAHPASFNGTGDTFHYCQPGPGDWGLDAVLRHVARSRT